MPVPVAIEAIVAVPGKEFLKIRKMKGKIARDVDEYISFHPAIVLPLEKLRQTIRKAAPLADEGISYQMPAYKFHGALVYFAGYKNHIGLYPTGSGISAFKEQLEKYETSIGTVKFPLDKPLPLSLIAKIVKYRVAENLEKEKVRSKKR